MTSIMRIQVARKILFGKGALELLPDEIRLLSGKKVFLVMDEGFSQTAMADKIVARLKEGGFPFILFNFVCYKSPIREKS